MICVRLVSHWDVFCQAFIAVFFGSSRSSTGRKSKKATAGSKRRRAAAPPPSDRVLRTRLAPSEQVADSTAAVASAPLLEDEGAESDEETVDPDEVFSNDETRDLFLTSETEQVDPGRIAHDEEVVAQALAEAEKATIGTGHGLLTTDARDEREEAQGIFLKVRRAALPS